MNTPLSINGCQALQGSACSPASQRYSTSIPCKQELHTRDAQSSQTIRLHLRQTGCLPKGLLQIGQLVISSLSCNSERSFLLLSVSCDAIPCSVIFLVRSF